MYRSRSGFYGTEFCSLRGSECTCSLEDLSSSDNLPPTTVTIPTFPMKKSRPSLTKSSEFWGAGMETSHWPIYLIPALTTSSFVSWWKCSDYKVFVHSANTHLWIREQALGTRVCESSVSGLLKVLHLMTWGWKVFYKAEESYQPVTWYKFHHECLDKLIQALLLMQQCPIFW